MGHIGPGSVTLTGAAELERKLLGMERKVGRKVIRQALRKGAKVIAAAAVSRSPTASGKLRASHKVRAMGRQRPGSYGIAVTTGRDAGNFASGEAYYGAFVHWGHMVGRRALGDRRAVAAARPWITQAYEAAKGQAEATVLAELAAGIERVAAEGKTT